MYLLWVTVGDYNMTAIVLARFHSVIMKPRTCCTFNAMLTCIYSNEVRVFSRMWDTACAGADRDRDLSCEKVINFPTLKFLILTQFDNNASHIQQSLKQLR